MHKDKILQRYNVTTQNYNIQPLFKIIAIVYYTYLFWKVNSWVTYLEVGFIFALKLSDLTLDGCQLNTHNF